MLLIATSWEQIFTGTSTLISYLWGGRSISQSHVVPVVQGISLQAHVHRWWYLPPSYPLVHEGGTTSEVSEASFITHTLHPFISLSKSLARREKGKTRGREFLSLFGLAFFHFLPARVLLIKCKFRVGAVSKVKRGFTSQRDGWEAEGGKAVGEEEQPRAWLQKRTNSWYVDGGETPQGNRRWG